MKIRLWYLLPAIALGVLLGRISNSSGFAGGSTEDARSPRFTKSSEREGSGKQSGIRSRAARVREEASRAAPEQIPGLLKRLMASADPADRMCFLIEAFDSVDAATVEAIFLEFDRMRQESGHDHNAEYRMAAFVAGRETGGAVMDAWMKNGFKKNIDAAHESLFGWATRDPAGAERWLDGISADYPEEKSRLMRALIGGMTLENSEQAMAKLITMNEPERSDCVGDLCFQLVQSEGIDSAIKWMLQVKSAATPENQGYVDAVSKDVTRKMIWSGLGGDGVAATAERIENLHSSDPVETRTVQSALLQMPGVQSLVLLEKMSSGNVLSDPDAQRVCTDTAVFSALQRDPEAMMSWLGDHAGSPLYDSLVTTTCRVLSAGGKSDDLQRVLDSIGDSELRQRIETTLEN